MGARAKHPCFLRSRFKTPLPLTLCELMSFSVLISTGVKEVLEGEQVMMAKSGVPLVKMPHYEPEIKPSEGGSAEKPFSNLLKHISGIVTIQS